MSLVVAVSAAIEGFFQFGQRWRNYRSTAERLKTEGWLFLQLAGPYATATGSHAEVYPTFANRVEELIQKDVDVYITEVTAEKKGSQGRERQPRLNGVTMLLVPASPAWPRNVVIPRSCSVVLSSE